jgi:hypothetical protein
MTQIRPHLSNYDASMERVVNVESMDDVIAYINCHYPQWRPDIRQMVQIHCSRLDRRNGWDTWLIKLRGQPVMWMDGPLADVTTFDVAESV